MFLAFDTETTGLHPLVHRLVEVAGVWLRLDGRELATSQTLINPEIPIRKEVEQVYGITETMVRDTPAAEQIMPLFIEFLSAPDTVLLAHNGPFAHVCPGAALRH